MLNEREISMIRDFYQNMPNNLTSDYFAEKYQVSIRTIQNDLKKIRNSLKDQPENSLISTPSLGSHLEIKNEKIFEKQYLNPKKHIKLKQSDRVLELCKILLKSSQPLSKTQISNKLFISNSTLTNDLNKLSNIIKQYDLKIKRSSQPGIQIIGNELNVRRCLCGLGIYSSDKNSQFETQYREEIERILVNVLMKHHYNISDSLFQNLIVHIEVSIERIRLGFALRKTHLEILKNFKSEEKVAQEIFDELGKNFSFKASTAEILNLAIYLRGKTDYQDDSYVSADVDKLIVQALEDIKTNFNVDFTQEINLRISLALHIMPLITRIKFDIQNDNVMLDEIRKSFPLAFDMAAYTGLLIQKKAGKKIKESEVSYLAIYFNQYLQQYKSLSGSQKVLIVTSLKRSEDVLLRQRFITWFSSEISVLTMANIHDLTNVKVDDFDVVFTTEKTILTDRIGAILISRFPSEKEYSKIKLAIDGFKTKDDLLNLFSKNRFEFTNLNTKSEVLDRLIQISKDSMKDKSKEFSKAIQLREQLGSSYFGNSVALPHPISPFSVPTFVSVILLKHSIKWDEDNNNVDLVILVSIEKNNVKVFQLWNYLGKIIQDKNFVEKLKEDPTFDNFVKEFSKLIE